MKLPVTYDDKQSLIEEWKNVEGLDLMHKLVGMEPSGKLCSSCAFLIQTKEWTDEKTKEVHRLYKCKLYKQLSNRTRYIEWQPEWQACKRYTEEDPFTVL